MNFRLGLNVHNSLECMRLGYQFAHLISLSKDGTRKAGTSKRRRRSARDKRTRARQAERSNGNGQTAQAGQVSPQALQVIGQPLGQVKLNKRLKGEILSDKIHNGGEK